MKKEDIEEIRQALLETEIRVTESYNLLTKALQKKLNKDQKRFLEHFWDIRKRRVRVLIPLETLVLFELENLVENLEFMDNEMYSNAKKLVLINVEALMEKRFLSLSKDGEGTFIKLEPDGSNYLRKKHPSIVAGIEKVIDIIPPMAKIFGGLVAFIAAVLGLFNLFFGS